MDIHSFYDARPITTVLVGVGRKTNGRIVTASPAFGELVGEAPEALVGRALGDFIHEEDRGRVRDQFARLASRECKTFDGVGRMLTANGGVRWHTVHASLASGSNDDQQLGISVSALPVRLLPAKAANARRTSSTDRLSVALDLAPAVAASELAL
jgi:PAS domain S-box-containing protein